MRTKILESRIYKALIRKRVHDKSGTDAPYYRYSMAKGEVVFGFFALSVLFAGWLWLQESGEPATFPSWKNWLSENGFLGLKNDFEENGELY